MKKQSVVFLLLLLIVASCQVQGHVKSNGKLKTRDYFSKQFHQEVLTMSVVAADLKEGKQSDAKAKVKRLINENNVLTIEQDQNKSYLTKVYGDQTAQLIEVALDKYQEIIEGMNEALTTPNRKYINQDQWNSVARSIERINQSEVLPAASSSAQVNLSMINILIKPDTLIKNYNKVDINHLIINFSADVNGLDQTVKHLISS